MQKLPERYGAWAGNRQGTPRDDTRCITPIYTNPWDTGRQCMKKRGWGTDGLYCFQHTDKKIKQDSK